MNRNQFTPLAPGNLVDVRIPRTTVRSGRIKTEAVETVAFVPNPLPPALDWRELKLRLFDRHSEALLALGKLNGLHKRVQNSAGLLRAIWMREAKLSSQIEGVHTTAEELVLGGASRALPVRSRGKESANYVVALEHGVHSVLPTSKRLIREIHEKLLEGIADDRGREMPSGDFRRVHVYIGTNELGPENAKFVPPPPGDELSRCLDAFETFANNRPRDIPALIAIAMEHYQFEAIHPFWDGNGRVGRVLMSRSLVTEGLLDHPTVYFSAHIYRNKDKYNELLLRVSTHGDWASWIEFIIDAILISAIDSIVRSELLIDLRDRYYEQLKTLNAKSRTFAVVDHLFAVPVVNADEARKILGGVAKLTAYSDLAMLEKAGILTEITGQQRDRDWMAKDILAIIEAEDTESLKKPD
ncbi:MAG: Fic family protein [Planctomycetes bacterium]|nr:Fic family protein [Planctomycetota bacterium]